jgi:Cof subfamily protein (haloacid dehalogenase superfamily)
MASRIRMIAVDIDGTLLPTFGATISEPNRAALRAAEAAGVLIVIATGRRQTYAQHLVDAIGLGPRNIMLTSNGTVVRDFSGRLIERTLLKAATAQRLCSALRPYGQTMVFTFDREGPAGLVVENLAALHEQVAKWAEANRPYLLEVQPLELAFADGDEPIQGMLCGPVELVRRAESALAASDLSSELEFHRTEYPERDLGILDLLPPGCSKGVALAHIAEAHGIPASEVMAIGDNLNDVDMLDYAGHPWLMTNASPEMLAMADAHGWRLTAASNDENGVALAIDDAIARHPILPNTENEALTEAEMDAALEDVAKASW